MPVRFDRFWTDRVRVVWFGELTAYDTTAVTLVYDRRGSRQGGVGHSDGLHRSKGMLG